MSLFGWFKPKAVTLKDPGWMLEQGNSRIFAGSGITVTPATALNVSAVYAAVRILSETIASLPLKIYKATGDTRAIANHPLNKLLGVSCNGEQTAMELREFQMTNLGLRGNAYSQIIRDGRGMVAEINPLNSAFMRVDRNKAGELIFDYQEYGNARVYGNKDIWRVAALGSNGVLGLSPVALAKESIGVSIATESHAARMFTNGAQPAGVLEFEHELSQPVIEKLRTQFAEHYQGHKNAHKPMILEGGMKYHAIGMNADDSQFLESRKFQISEIARWYRIPLHMLAEMDKATFSNIEHQSIEFVVHTIRPWLVRLEQSISRDLLTAAERRTLFASHTVEGLLRGDTKSRIEAYGKAIQDGWMTRNEVRKLENLNWAPGLDEFILPLNMGGVSEREKDLTKNIADWVANREIKALQIEAARLSVADFAKWLPGFYDRHAATLSRELKINLESAKAYTMNRIDEISGYTNPAEAVEATSHRLNQQIEKLAYE